MSTTLLTLREAAEKLGYTPQYLQKKLRLQRLRGVRIGRKFGPSWAFTKADLLSIMDATLPVGHPAAKGGPLYHCH